jgi:hypothetical protein
VVGASGAGASADDRAAQLRAKAERLNEQAAWWEKGAAGERHTADLLACLPPGWLVFHDLSIPAGKANIDHVAVGPPGVFVIDTKYWRAPAHVGSGTLWCGRYPMRKEVETAAWETSRVTLAVAGAAPVWGLMCLLGPVDGPLGLAGTLTVVQATDLAAYLTGRPLVLGPSQVRHSADVIERALPPKAGWSGMVTRPAPVSTSYVPPVGGSKLSPGPPFQVARARYGSPSAAKPARRPPRTGRREPARRQTAGNNKVVEALGLTVVAVLMFTVGPRVIQSISAPILRAVPSSTVPTTVGPLKYDLALIRWSCPGAGAGWTAVVSFDSHGASWMIQTGPTDNGPWAVVKTGKAGTPQAITGVKAATSFFARAVNGATVASPPVTTGDPLRAPTAAC